MQDLVDVLNEFGELWAIVIVGQREAQSRLAGVAGALGAGPAAAGSWTLEAEAAAAWFGRNDVRIPGDTGTAFDLRVILFLGNMIPIQAPMSIGFAVDNSWGQDPPYCGVDYSPNVYGCGAGYYDHEHWGEPRWTQYNDVAYSLDDTGVVAVEPSTWTSVKDLYR